MKVLVCDDQPERCREVQEAISEGSQGIATVQPLCGEELSVAISSLFSTVNGCLKDPAGYVNGVHTAFDNFDLAIVDDNLTHLETRDTRLTAEDIVGYVRAFTSTPYTISLNRHSDLDFDVRFLVGDDSTRADLALNIDHLRNPSLWNGDIADADDGFRPWYWPTLSTVADKRRGQIHQVYAHLGDRVLDVLGFPRTAQHYLSRHAKSGLSTQVQSDSPPTEGKQPADVSFIEVFQGGTRSLPLDDDKAALSGAVANPAVAELIARIVAADLDLWFRRDVIAPQEVLVDVPHLVARMPFLLGEGVQDLTRWNATIRATNPPYGLDEDLYRSFVRITRFAEEHWVPRPMFWWPDIKANEALGRLMFEQDFEWLDAVFCEDCPSFIEPSKTSDEQAPVEFVAAFEGSWTRRHVLKLPGRGYLPLSRFGI